MKVLPIPYVKQLPGHCGPACLEMVLNYYGIKKTQKEIAKTLDPNIALVGTNPQALYDYIKTQGLQPTITINTELSEVIENIDRGIPTIVLQTNYIDPPHVGHFRIVIGYDQLETPAAKIVMHDPELGKHIPTYIPLFEELWNNMRVDLSPKSISRIALTLKK